MPYFSIVTPTHNTQFLARLSRSIARQTFKDFEWIIVPNGNANIDVETLAFKPKVVYAAYPNSKLIGDFKKRGCFASQGTILVEVDHDDEITEDCLQELYNAFNSDETIDFAYSNCAEINIDGEPFVYSNYFGWRNRPFKYYGKDLLELISFDPNPASFSKIWFAPNHVRAWKKSFYDKIGGHDETMEVLDDHDILCRTYIQGKVKHIDKCLYIYYKHKDNTCYGEKNAFIQSETLNIHDKYIYGLTEKWCDINGLLKIDLCGGFNSPKGYKSIDVQNAEIIHNLNDPWPFKNGEVGLIRAHDALEHLRDPVHVMKEAYRCLCPMGWFLTQTPSTDGRGAFQDPTHITFWNSNSFWYYTKKSHAEYIGMPVRFQANRIKNFFPTEWSETHKILYVKADLIRLPDKDLNVRVPGEVLI